MKENDESKDRQSRVSTCFEGLPCAEMMQEIVDEGGVGSLCAEMMRSWMKKCREGKEEPRESENDESPINGGVK
jgi:hypothetical protein